MGVVIASLQLALSCVTICVMELEGYYGSNQNQTPVTTIITRVLTDIG